ncbi:MAG: HAD-IIIA family hydrolase [Bacilli bacterium]
MITVIMAGGKGTRISSINKDIPKPMIQIDGMPVLEREIYCLKEQGFVDLIITVNYLKDIIINYFGDGSKVSPITNKPFGVHISYYEENEPLGNAGALFKIKDQLKEDFLLINADSIFDVDLNKFVKFHQEKKGLVTLFTHPNSHPFDSSIIITNNDDEVLSWIGKNDIHPTWYQNKVNAGLHIVSPLVLDNINTTNPIVDLDKDILKPLANTDKMYAYQSSEYIKDMGTPERYNSVSNDFSNGIVKDKSLRNKQRAIFLDRDGTINKYVGFLTNIDDFNLIDGVSEAISKINRSRYLAIVVTNQPVVARGEVSFTELKNIHNKMETLLGNSGAYLDKIYYCPHHPDKGFKGEIPELKIDCECRKPKIGMLIKAQNDFNIDLKKSWFIGDGNNDILCGINGGCNTIFLGDKKDCKNKPTYYAKDLNEAVDIILKGDN